MSRVPTLQRDSKLRILFVTPFYYPDLRFGGPPKRLHTIAKKLRACDEVVCVLTLGRRDHQRGLAQYDGIPVRYVPHIGNSLREIPTSWSKIDAAVRTANLVHCYGLYNLLCPLAALSALRNGKPFLLEPMGMFVPRNRSLLMKRIYNATVTTWMARHAAAIVATSELEAEELRPIGSASLTVRGNGIDLNEFRNLPPRSVMRDKWGVGLANQLIIYVGRISAKKRLIELVQAFERAAIPESRLVIAGPVSESDYLIRLNDTIAALRVGDRVMITEAIYAKDLLSALSAADLFVLPSENENFGNAAAEAVAAGVPVLLTETCGVAPLIHGRAGLAVPLGIDSLASGLRTMVDPERRRGFLSDPEAVKRDLSWDEPIAQTIALYERILAESRK